MTINNLERVMWRLRKLAVQKKYKNPNHASNFDLRRAIMFECGTNPRTICVNRKALIELGWIKTVGTSFIRLTNADISGDDD